MFFLRILCILVLLATVVNSLETYQDCLSTCKKIKNCLRVTWNRRRRKQPCRLVYPSLQPTTAVTSLRPTRKVTNSPSSSVPSLRPTRKATNAPTTAVPSLRAPSSSVPSLQPTTTYPVLKGFKSVPEYSNACETYRADPSRDSKRFDGIPTVHSCVQICEYDSRCEGMIYYVNNLTCIKAVRIQLIDVDEPVTEPIIAYYRGNLPSYYAGYCSLYDTKDTCNESAGSVCRWNQGKQGINQHRVVNLGWCGRILCK